MSLNYTANSITKKKYRRKKETIAIIINYYKTWKKTILQQTFTLKSQSQSLSRRLSPFPAQPFLFDHVCGLLGNHYDRSVGVSTDQRGHDGRIHHPEPVDTVNPEPRVHHCGLIPFGPHLGGTHWMVYGHRVMANHTFPVGVRIPRYRGTAREWYVMQTAVVPAERRGLGHGHHELNTLHQRVHVLLNRQIVGQNPRIHGRIGAS